MLRPYQTLQRYWASEPDRPMRTRPAGEAAVAALEMKYDLRLPGDFREYLLLAAPAGDHELDQECTLWWQLARIRNVPDEYKFPVDNPVIAAEAKRYLFFADFMVWCMAWAINCAEDEHRGRVVVFNGGGERFVADSFAEFVDRYVENVGPLL